MPLRPKEKSSKGYVLGLDPGSEESALVVFARRDQKVVHHVQESNEGLLRILSGGLWAYTDADALAIEMITSYGMAVGESVFETCFWVGRFFEAWSRRGGTAVRIKRGSVKMAICHTMAATDANIRQALIDMLGPAGTKKSPGPTYGIAKDRWAALAVAVTCSKILDQHKGEEWPPTEFDHRVGLHQPKKRGRSKKKTSSRKSG